MSFVQSVDRAFALLRAVAVAPAGISELSRRLDLPTSTVARLLSTLEAVGAVIRLDGESSYTVGPLVDELAGGPTPVQRLITVARPHMESLGAEIGEAVGLAVPAGYDVHYVSQVECQNPVQVRDWTGERIPMHVVSSGQALLATWPDEAIVRYARRPLEPFTPTSLATGEALVKRLRQVRETGISWTIEEFAEGISSVGAVVRDMTGVAVAAIHVHGPTFRFPVEGSAGEVANALMAATQAISTDLGHGTAVDH